jgi:hypothetical protein
VATFHVKGLIGEGKINLPPHKAQCMSNLRAYVMNSKVQGESFSEEVDGKVVRDTLVFTCEGQRFILQTQPKQLAEILVEKVGPLQVTATMEAIERICWLLAFATQMAHPTNLSNPSIALVRRQITSSTQRMALRFESLWTRHTLSTKPWRALAASRW